MTSFYQTRFFKIIGTFLGIVPSFLLYSSYTCFSGALIFRKNEEGFWGLFLPELLPFFSCPPPHFVLQKEFGVHQIFNLLDRKNKKKNLRLLYFWQMNNFENLYLTKDLSILGFRPSFAAKLADFERKIISCNW